MSFPSQSLKRLVNPSRSITYGIVQAGEHVAEGVPYIRPIDMAGHAGVDARNLQRTSPEIAAAYRRSSLRTGDLVVSIGPSFGKTMLVPAELDGANLTQGTARVAVREGVNARFVLWCLQSKTSTSYWESSVGGATFRALNLGPLNETPIPSPPLGVQRQIADYLDHETAEIDAFIADLTIARRITQERRIATIDEVVSTGTPRTLRRALDSAITGPFGTILSASEYVEGGVPLVNPVNIRANRIVVDQATSVSRAKADELSRYRLRQGDVVLARKGDVGKAALVGVREDGFICGSDSLALRPNGETHPQFLWWQLQGTVVRQQLDAWSVGSTVTGLNQEIMSKIIVNIPSIARQSTAVKRASTMAELHDAEIADIDAAIALAKERRAALITAAVTGQIDLTMKQLPAVDSIHTAIEESR